MAQYSVKHGHSEGYPKQKQGKNI